MREDLEDFETNQQVIGMKLLFRVFSIKVLKGSEFGGNNHVACSRIVNQNCMNYCCKCWKDRNEKMHEEVFQRKRIIHWQQKERVRSLKEQHL